ncbi:hypothetical protein QBC44DRAFT_299670 [Cladorrhinum sp. PSN332]|nr:hypothetical protein QBC44DRAFT_299670 [Cladorrhinum sp. PSN332]
MQSSIQDTGISVVYEPKECPPVADIIIVHGLQGHPFKTWAFPSNSKLPGQAHSERAKLVKGKGKNVQGKFRRMFSLPTYSRKRVPSEIDTGADSAGSISNHTRHHVFWPADLLPAECPNSRILVYGYDSNITKYMAGPANQNSLRSHAKDLLFALQRDRPLGRPILFIAHSLGGIVVKEMLSQSSNSDEAEIENIAESTKSVTFLGTPHRGSPDFADVGETIRAVLGALRMGTASANLDALGLRTTDLERAQDEFSRIWHKHGFRVKTFQEGLGLTGLNLGVLGNKVVPDYSSLIGDYRERAETLQANHMDMCRFSGEDDPNFRKVSGEIRSRYLAVEQARVEPLAGLNRVNTCFDTSPPRPKERDVIQLGSDEQALLPTLWFPRFNARFRDLERPVDNTCLWLFNHPLYQGWATGRNIKLHHALLCLRGQPGVGKSTLMREAVRRSLHAETDSDESDHLTAAFFFNAKGDDLEHSVEGHFRSLLYQLLPKCQNRKEFQRAARDWKKGMDLGSGVNNPKTWTEAELRSMLRSLILDSKAKRLVIFIDALDECDQSRIRALAHYWWDLTKTAHHAGDVQLNVCLSSRHFPWISLSDCLDITVECHNKPDIEAYVKHKFELVAPMDDLPWQNLRNLILARSAGIFLWAVLVVDDVLRCWDAGEGMHYLQNKVNEIPQPLSDLYSRIIDSVGQQQRRLMVRLFQWAILPTAPLRLHEWHHVLAFIREPTPISLSEWRESNSFTSDDAQLERKIRSISKGLVEIRTVAACSDGLHEKDLDLLSVCAGAGSLNLETGETRVVQVIHETVRDFFKDSGFALLDPSLAPNAVGRGHLSIMQTCLDYINIKELDALFRARSRVENSRKRQQSQDDPAMPTYSRESRSRSPEELKGVVRVDDNDNFQHDDSNPEPRPQPGSIDSWLLLTSTETAGSIDAAILSHAYSPGRSTECDRLSTAGQSQVLEDYPALLSYALSSMFAHAQLAEVCGSSSENFVGQFLQGGWSRWRILKEDVPEDWTVLTYAAAHGIHSWAALAGQDIKSVLKDLESIPQRPNDPRVANPMPRNRETPHAFDGEGVGSSSFFQCLSIGDFDPLSNTNVAIDNEWSDGDIMPSQHSPHHLLERTGSAGSFGSIRSYRSVASFSSAASHQWSAR